MSARFTMSSPFARFLETLVIEEGASVNEPALVLVCQECGEALCDVEAEDSLLVLTITALEHDEKCPRSEDQDRRD